MNILELQALNRDNSLGLYLPSHQKSIVFAMNSLKDSTHSILYVIDSMGIDILNEELQVLFTNYGKITSSVFPSVTPVAFTSIITSFFPDKHGIHGHIYYNPISRDLYDFLRYPETKPPHVKEELIKSLQHVSTWTIHVTHNQIHIYLPEPIIKGAFTKILFKNTQVHSYKNLSMITKHVYNVIKTSESSFQVVYFNDLDELIHEYGKTSFGREQVNKTLREFMNHLRQLHGLLERDQFYDVKCTITADHGQINTPIDKILCIRKEFWENLRQHLFVKAMGQSGRVYHVFSQLTEADKVISLLEKEYHKYSVIMTEYGLANALQYQPSLFKIYEESLEITPIHIIMKPHYTFHDCNIPRLLSPMNANHGSLTKEELLVPEITCFFKDIKF